MVDRAAIDSVLEANRYLVLGTADADGRPWATPVFFARLGEDSVCWVSAPDSRHSRNIAGRSSVAITVFDSTVEVGHAEAAYFDAEAAPATPAQIDGALQALNSRLARDKRLTVDDLLPRGPLAVFRAELQRHYVLVRGGDVELANVVDVTVEV